ncbi:MAG TPA: Mur ligase family protein [Candidatus Limnocylindrales bacterium]|nr:Mur ligase family protein [Candidatus Limnocylindrales bacterium]
MRLLEIRLYEGPNVYRLQPVVKVEVAVGRTRAWHGTRTPADGALVHLGRPVPAREWPDAVTDLVAWSRRLRADHGEGGGPCQVHRASDAGRWVVQWPWSGAERSRLIAEAAFDLASRSVHPGRRVRLTGTQQHALDRWADRIGEAQATPPAWIRDEQRRMPVVSITGTNGKSTVTRLITHILLRAGRQVGTTTSDGIMVDERLVDAGDWTGPGGAAAVLRRSDVDVAVLETARGGLVLKGMGYESNEASVFTNVSSDHLDLQGIHTLPELAEVKSTVCRVTKPDGWVVLNADDPLVAAVARRVHARVAYFSLDPDGSALIARHRRDGGRCYVLRRGVLLEWNGAEETAMLDVADLPVALGGLARHNVANALAAAGGARALGATPGQVADGLRHFRPSADLSPGRLNLFRLGRRTVIVDFAHNEAGTAAILDVAAAIAGGAEGQPAPVTAIIGTAGDRPDDTLRGIGRLAAERAQRVAVKETLAYLRGRTRESIVETLLEGVRAGGMQTDGIPVYETETEALEAELVGSGAAAAGAGAPEAPGVVILFCHEQRDEVFALLDRLGARQLDAADAIAERSRRPADGRRS